MEWEKELKSRKPFTIFGIILLAGSPIVGLIAMFVFGIGAAMSNGGDEEGTATALGLGFVMGLLLSVVLGIVFLVKAAANGKHNERVMEKYKDAIEAEKRKKEEECAAEEQRKREVVQSRIAATKALCGTETMNVAFKSPGLAEWTLTEDRITIGRKTILLSSITDVKHNHKRKSHLGGSITVTYGDGLTDSEVLMYPVERKSEAMSALKYIFAFVGGEAALKKLEKELEEIREIETKGFRKRCNVCGQFICYTLNDLDRNKENSNNAFWSNVSSVAGTLSGHYVAGAVTAQTANSYSNQVVDYSKCPKCGSRDLVDLTDEDIAKFNAPQLSGETTSSADELKKFKELLDMGAITQEEFDAKKKQLLGM